MKIFKINHTRKPDDYTHRIQVEPGLMQNLKISKNEKGEIIIEAMYIYNTLQITLSESETDEILRLKSN